MTICLFNNPGYKTRAYLRFALCLACLPFLTVACSDDDDDDTPTPTAPISLPAASYDDAVVLDWFALSLDLTQSTPGYTPPVAARTFAYMGLTCFESVIYGMPYCVSFSERAGNGGQGGALPAVPTLDNSLEHHWPTVANHALATMMTKMFVFNGAPANNMVQIDALRSSFDEQFNADIDADVRLRSQEYGNLVAEHIYDWSTSDGGHEAYLNNFPSDYTPPAGEPGLWVPTPPAFSPALQPYWGEVRAFATDQTSVTDTDPGAPPPFSLNPESQFYTELQEVYDVSQNLTDEQIIIAEYWSDDPGLSATPPGHSISILLQLSNAGNGNLQGTVNSFAKLGLALHDAFVSCWKSKYQYSYVRPITVIQRDLGFDDWTSVVGTPPFPEYTSGHSVQSGAMTEVLTDLYGSNYAFTDNTHASRVDIDGSPRSFSSFDEAAQEAAISRLYGGIHYRSAIDLGVTQGREVGRNVLNMFIKIAEE